MRHLILWLVPIIALVVPELVAAQTPSPAPRTDAVTLSPGDSVRITVWRKPEFSGDFIVAPDGTISHPLYRSVRIAGVPVATAEANLRTFLARFEQDPQFVMEPLVRVAVSGEVGRPQVFALRPETLVSEAVAQAGGPTQNAKRDRVRVLRREPNGGQQELVVNLMDPAQGTMLRIHSGDQIVVDRRRSFFREIVLPGLSVIGSVASIYLLIERTQRN